METVYGAMPSPTNMILSRTRFVLTDVWDERVRQAIKWGQQNYLDGTARPGSVELADHYRAVCQSNTPDTDNWQDILLEEVYEAMAESDPEKLRAELVQVAAVAVSWIESLDRRSRG